MSRVLLVVLLCAFLQPRLWGSDLRARVLKLRDRANLVFSGIVVEHREVRYWQLQANKWSGVVEGTSTALVGDTFFFQPINYYKLTLIAGWKGEIDGNSIWLRQLVSSNSPSLENGKSYLVYAVRLFTTLCGKTALPG